MRWKDLTDNQKANGINIRWTGCDDNEWHWGGQFAGQEGAIITGPVKGMVHVPFKSIWSEPAYAPPRFERTVDERKEIGLRLTTFSDSEYGWFDTEEKLWAGLNGDEQGWFHVWTRRYGELYLPMQLLDSVENELEDDPSIEANGSMHEWDILLAADGEPRFRQPDLYDEWQYVPGTPTKMVTQDDEKFSPKIEVGVGQLKVANRSPTRKAWPVYHVSAPGRCWLEDGMSGRMFRVPKLPKGMHVRIDTNPENRIVIGAKDPIRSNWMTDWVNNSDLLQLFLRDFGAEAIPILEQFHGQGFETPLEPRTENRLTVYHSEPGARVSVSVPQRFERPFS